MRKPIRASNASAAPREELYMGLRIRMISSMTETSGMRTHISYWAASSVAGAWATRLKWREKRFSSRRMASSLKI